MPTPALPLSSHIAAANSELEGLSAEEVIRWTVSQYGPRAVASTSFGAHSAVMLHLISRVSPSTPVVFIDTGYLFPETYRFAEQLRERFQLNLHVYTPQMTGARLEALEGKLWEQADDGVERYLFLHKVEPMQRALEDLQCVAWLAGVRKEQTDHRGSLPRVAVQDGRLKVHPILGWSTDEVEAYMAAHQLPLHPLYHDGYRSVGDWHSTLPTTPDMDPRAGRMLGKKQECGLHLPLSDEEEESLRSSGL